MDLEWRRRQTLVGKMKHHINPYRDVRYEGFPEHVGSDWSQERIRSLITLDGINANPEDHMAWIENPLVPVDLVQTMGCRWIDEMEDELKAMGHLATPEDERNFAEEVVLDTYENVLGMNEFDLLHQIAEDDDEDEEREEFMATIGL